ncbi:unnamed protein product [Meloidogyne enterolobii]|uniref:Uncharacterized protein n=1 Tax=Meloidogyne enterolobii TaxID=390850 RepID=A0ACB1B0Z5_MELEN
MAEEGLSTNIEHEMAEEGLSTAPQKKPKKNRGPARALKRKIGSQQRRRMRRNNALLAATQATEENKIGDDDDVIEETTTTEVDASSTQEKANDLFDNKNYVSAIKYNKLYNKYLNRKKTPFKCIICLDELNHDEVYSLKNCNHTFHEGCITFWIAGAENCPTCRVQASLDDIKHMFFEVVGSPDDSDDEFTQSSSNMTNAVNNLNSVKFVQIKNKWRRNNWNFICCSKNCINSNNPFGTCINGNGFGNIIDDENIKYTNCFDQSLSVMAENAFKRPQNCFNYSSFYFEIKCIYQKDEKENKMTFSLADLNKDECIRLFAHHATIKLEESKFFKIDHFAFNNNDVFGCGLVYPPNNKLHELPYAFFTQNGKQIGKAVLLTYNSDSYKPCISLQRCSIKANFGNDLETKPFIYDISKHTILKEFYYSDDPFQMFY